ncbi:MAG: hypothetical protein ABIX28_11255 [Vicinamibacterales bacterium]
MTTVVPPIVVDGPIVVDNPMPDLPPMWIEDWRKKLNLDESGHVVDGSDKQVFPHSGKPPLTPEDIEKIGRWLELPRPERDTTGELHFEKLPVWWLELNNEQTHALTGTLTAGAGFAAALIGPLTVIAAAILASVPYIEAMNRAGGNNGVEISGVLGTLGVIVTPRLGKWPRDLVNFARDSVQGKTILDLLLYTAGRVPAVGNALNIPAVAGLVAAVAGPIGWIVGGVGAWLLNSDNDGEAAAVLANRDQVGEWERFTLAHVEQNNRMGLISWRGLFSAQSNGGQGVYANRAAVGPWELWTLIPNSDGTVSLRANDDQHFLCAEEGGGRECQVNRTQIGAWERFWLVPQPDGYIALKTFSQGKYVSVQP